MASLDRVASYALNRLGSRHVVVELDNRDLAFLVDEALKKFSRVRPLVKAGVITASAGLSTYPLSTIVPTSSSSLAPTYLGVVDVKIPTVDPIAPLLMSAGPKLDIFGFRYSYPYRDLSELELDYTYFLTATRELSSEFDWIWDEDNDVVAIAPQPTDSFNITVFTSHKRTLDVTTTVNNAMIGQGDGSTKQFSNNIVNIPIETFSASVSISGIDPSIFSLQDDGGGNLLGAGGYGTINYTTGAVTVKVLLDAPPAIGQNVLLNYNLVISAGKFREDDVDWLQNYTYALALTNLAKIRGKFTGIPGTDVNLTMDFAALAEEGENLRKELEVDLRARTPDIPMYRA